jgi:Transposase Tn5 dimerisation domain
MLCKFFSQRLSALAYYFVRILRFPHHQPPVEPPTLGEAVLMLARLGGFLARQGDGVPGVKTIWRGLSRLTDLVAMWRLLHQQPHPT